MKKIICFLFFCLILASYAEAFYGSSGNYSIIGTIGRGAYKQTSGNYALRFFATDQPCTHTLDKGYDLYLCYYFSSIPTTSLMDVTLTANPSQGIAPLPVNFTATITGGTPPYTYDWDFDNGIYGDNPNESSDNTSSATQNKNYTYSTPRPTLPYIAYVRATDSALKTDIGWAQVVVNALPGDNAPTAACSLTQNSTNNFTADASGSSDIEDGTNLKYCFDWSDPQIACSNITDFTQISTQTHTFSHADTFPVTVYVRDSSGQESNEVCGTAIIGSVQVPGNILKMISVNVPNYIIQPTALNVKAVVKNMSSEQVTAKVKFFIGNISGNIIIPIKESDLKTINAIDTEGDTVEFPINFTQEEIALLAPKTNYWVYAEAISVSKPDPDLRDNKGRQIFTVGAAGRAIPEISLLFIPVLAFIVLFIVLKK